MNSYIIRQITIDDRIYGLLYEPLISGKKPLAIYAHELANTHERGEEYAKFFASHGIVTYIFDFCGGSNNSKSIGKTTEMSVLTEEDDLDAVIKFLRKLDVVDKDNIFLIGASLGGVVASLYGYHHPEVLNSLILLYPGFNVYDMFHHVYQSLEDVPNVFSFRGWMDVGKVFAKDIWHLNPYDCMGSFDRPVLILHGEEDKIVPISYSQKALDYYSKSRLIILKGASHHIFFKEHQRYAQNCMLDFIKENLH